MVKPIKAVNSIIRTEAVGPFVTVVVCTGLYFNLLFDFQLRKGLEWAFTQGNGAEVNIDSLKTSFWNASFEMKKIEFTNPKIPTENRIEIGEVGFKAHWDALLRAKAVIDRMGVTGILMGTPRMSPGRVIPPEEQKENKSVLMTALKNQIQGTALGDGLKLLDGFDPSKELKGIGDRLKSAAHIQKVKEELNTKSKNWDQALKSMPSDQELSALQAKVAAVKVGGTSNPAEIQKQIQTLQEIAKSSQAQANAVSEQGSKLASDVQSVEKGVNAIDGLVAEDRKDIESRMKLPKIDAESLAKEILGPEVMSKVGQSHQVMGLAQKYMSKTKNSKAAKAGEPKEEVPARGLGRNYEFGRPGTYPKFWVKLIEASSSAENTEFSGNVRGEIRDLVSNPKATGKPIVATLTAEFPRMKVTGVELRAELDKPAEDLIVKLQGKIGSFPIANQVLSESPELKLAIKNAVGSTRMTGTYTPEKVAFEFDSRFENTIYETHSSSKPMDLILKSATDGLKTTTLFAKVSGLLSNPDIEVRSNLTEAIAGGLKHQLDAKIGEARKQVDAEIQKKIGSERASLTQSFDQTKKKTLGPIEEKKKKVEGVGKEVQTKIAQAENAAKSGAAGKAADAIKKKFKF